MTTETLMLSMQAPAERVKPAAADPVEEREIKPEDYVDRTEDGRIYMVHREWEYDGAELLTHADGWTIDFAGGSTNFPLVARCRCGALHVDYGGDAYGGRWVETGTECQSERYAELVKRPIEDVQRCIWIKH